MTKVAYLLPGQGAQAVGMGKAFYDRYDSSRDIYKHANTQLGFDIAALCFEGPQETLMKTEYCQAALFVTSIAAFTAFRELAPSFQVAGAAGLSLGEISALTVADALAFSDALYLVRARGDLMAECAAHNKGTMLAVIGLSNDAIESISRESGAWAANYNASDQVVMSGTVESIEKAEALAKSQGAKRAIRLDVAGAFHSPIMQPAADKFSKILLKAKIKPPRFAVISNVTGLPVLDPDEIRGFLSKQIVSPVRWEQSMRYLIKEGSKHFIEFPPARVLTGLLRRIDSTVKGIPIDEPKDFDPVLGILRD